MREIKTGKNSYRFGYKYLLDCPITTEALTIQDNAHA